YAFSVALAKDSFIGDGSELKNEKYKYSKTPFCRKSIGCSEQLFKSIAVGKKINSLPFTRYSLHACS
ncbi:MAG TPA: hypothetical protein VJK54_05635, partial [Chthoniobacterales bacterium]|nr:hypothetical protein [Chthoniobacterales bacterium]